MCTRYISPEDREIEAQWHIGRRHGEGWVRDLRPLSIGPFLKLTDEGLERVVAQWGFIPPWSKTKIPTGTNGKRLTTVNARVEGVAKSPTYRDAWKKGQRCIVPARSFFEPNWESGKNVWWNFERADGALWGIAGLWSEWKDFETGEIVPNYTMLTMNADEHPLMSRMHKPDPKLPPDQQDKRSLVLLEAGDFDRWLKGTVEDALELVKLTPEALFKAGPV